MMIVKLMGGLGNQLFQYAMARRIIYFGNCPLKLDISEYQNNKLRKYSLNNFNIIGEVASLREIALFKNSCGKKPFFLKLISFDKTHAPYKYNFIKERFFHFDPGILKISGDAYLEGYWQSEKYFKDIENIIRQEFTLKQEPDSQNRKMIEYIKNVNSVSIHVRRGDYIFDSATSQFHGCCPVEYYYQALEELEKYIERPYLFIFSDDHRWAQENLEFDYPVTFVTHNGPDKDYEDLRLMSLCMHHIIANSTFSWWGAWLCENKEKIVIAPKKWFNNAEHNTSDLIPDTWHRI